MAQDAEDVGVGVPPDDEVTERREAAEGACPEVGDNGADPQFMLEAHGEAVHGGPAGVTVLRTCLVSGHALVGGVDPLLCFEDLLVGHGVSFLFASSVRLVGVVDPRPGASY